LRRRLQASLLFVCFTASAIGGYVVSDRLGSETLRLEAQRQLGELMQGSVRIARARVVLRGGLFLEGERVGVYPSETSPHQPALFASTVSAELHVPSLLIGRFRLNTLVLDDAVLEIHRAPDGRLTPPPFQRLADRQGAGPSSDLERSLDWVHAFEAVTRGLLESPVVARRVEVRRGRIRFVDRMVAGPDAPITLALYRVNGRLLHHWLSGEAELTLGAALFGGGGRPVQLRAEGWQRGGNRMRLALAADGLPLAMLAPYLLPSDAPNTLGGLLGGEVAYETRAEQHGTVRLRAHAEDFATTIDVRDGHYEIERPGVALDAALEIHPGRVRLDAGRIDAEGIAFTLGGAIERPLGPASRARLEIDVDGLELAEVREIARSLPDADGVALEHLLARVDEGRVDHIGARGTARIDEWGDLFVGEAERLPRGFVLVTAVSEVVARANEHDRLSGLEARIVLSGDRIELRDARGEWNEEPLPRFSLSVEGVSRLFAAPEWARPLAPEAAALPGLSPLFAILESDADGGDPATRAELVVDRLAHPLLRWPVTGTRVVVDDAEPGLHVLFEGGRWAGAPFEGEALWRDGPDESLRIDLHVHPWDGASRDGVFGSVAGGVASTSWASGRFRMDAVRDGPLPLSDVTGGFELSGSTLSLHEIRGDLDPNGALRADVELRLDHPEQVGTTFAFDIVEGDVDRLGRSFGLAAGQATGRVGLSGRLEGDLRPQTPLLASLSGDARLVARQGEIRRDELPLMLALAQARAGYNEHSERDAVAYDAIEASFVIEDGRVSTDDFELDGPLRVYGSGSVDVVRPPHEMVAVVGLFLFRSAGHIMETIPLVKAVLPGSERGLVGAYYQVSGPAGEPQVDALAGRSLAEDLPDLLAVPYRLLRAILGAAAGREPPQAPARRADQ